MTQRPGGTHEATELAALYALGALEEAEAKVFASHLADCEECRAEVRAYDEVASNLVRGLVADAPPPGLRVRVLDAVAAPQTRADWKHVERDGIAFLRSASVPWQKIPGLEVECKTLFKDSERGLVTRLVRMGPGAQLPPHRHADVEESFLLEGDLVVEGVAMRGGDYCRAAAGSVHREVRTVNGCTFVAISSLADQRLEG